MFICTFIYNVNIDEFFQNFQLAFTFRNIPKSAPVFQRNVWYTGIPMLYNSCKQLQSTGFVYIEDCSL